MFDVFYTGKKPNRFAHERPADSLEHAAELSRTRLYWYIYADCDYSEFDFNYVPPPWQEHFLHVWPTQWNQHGGAYLANKNTVNEHQWQFHDQVVTALPSTDHWRTIHPVGQFDYSWQPHPHDPPYIYVFGNQWYIPEQMPTVEYHVPGATERKYMQEPQAQLAPTTEHWQVLSDVPVDFDFSWCPDPHDPPYIYVFGNQHWAGERSATVEYHVPGATERKFVGDLKAYLGVLDIFFVDKSNQQSDARWQKIKQQYPSAQSIRYANSMIRTIERCVTRARSPRFWVISSENIYDDFDFDWHAEPWQQHMTHVFGSQWNKWSDTYMINASEFRRHSAWAQGIEQFPNLNFVDNQRVYVPDDLHDIYYVDHNNTNDLDSRARLLERYPRVKITRFVDNYLDTFKRIMSTASTEYVWICNSVCDYGRFDFTWQPEPWQRHMIHVFPSGHAIEGPQRRGDTFYIHVESFKQQMYDLELLDWFNVINYCEDQFVPRLPMPIVYYDGDTLVDPVKNYQFDFPHALFTTEREFRQSHIVGLPCLWSAKDRQVESFNQGGDTAIVPREIKSYLKTQIYDYPYIAKRSQLSELNCDVVFISNGESMAEEHWAHLLTIYPGAKRSNGVLGREQAYKAAARLSATPWFFAVFAKTYVLPEFKFRFRPDYFQEPKHYIFHSRNPLNGLEYGAMNINLYNRQLVLDTDPGLDFTLSKAHAVIPICASISRFNTDPWITWRSAFRETMKLRLEVDQGASIEIEHRLKTWLTVAQGENAEYCLQGARDGVEYYESVAGDYEALELSFDWAWCQDYYYKKYQRKIWLEVV